MVDHRTQFGLDAEGLVSDMLVGQGFRILDRNWRRPWGELDVVALKDAVIHFVEVKASRRHVDGFAPELRADWRKMAKVRRTARTWLTANHCSPDTEWQIDVASVIMREDTAPVIEIFPQE
ncbi:MAG TPA: YraN family protein [Candidatus Paceibacterota bacterium]|nr:YraN family protein [Candidatus Paceibacterota bacterium]